MDAPRLVTCCLVVAVAAAALAAPTASASPRAFFVFGDSLVDNGNNNYLITTARADAPPYGIDFPTHMPTGRFSNGLNIPDIISCVPPLPALAVLLPVLSLCLLLLLVVNARRKAARFIFLALFVVARPSERL